MDPPCVRNGARYTVTMRFEGGSAKIFAAMTGEAGMTATAEASAHNAQARDTARARGALIG